MTQLATCCNLAVALGLASRHAFILFLASICFFKFFGHRAMLSVALCSFIPPSFATTTWEEALQSGRFMGKPFTNSEESAFFARGRLSIEEVRPVLR